MPPPSPESAKQKPRQIAEFEGALRGWPALVVGNGESRLQYDLTEVPEHVVTFGCNAIYRDYRMDFLGAVDVNITTEFKTAGLHFRGYFLAPEQRMANWTKDNSDVGNVIITNRKGWSTGPMMVISSLILGCDPVYLLGFDMEWLPEAGKINNIYKGTPCYREVDSPPTHTRNWQKQFTMIFQEFEDREFYQLGPNSLSNRVKAAEWSDLRDLPVSSGTVSS